VTLGLSIGMGGVIAAALGAIADSTGLETVLWIVAALPLLGIPLASSLPSHTPSELPQRVSQQIGRAHV
jgi:FSR family fosmidomycin resistance protein-like MFS transporter